MTRSFPGRVMYLPVASSLLLDGTRFSAWLPPVGDPHAPKDQWTRVRKLDNVHLCPEGSARYARAILTDLTATNFDDSSLEFIERLVTALPHLSRDQVFWRFHFLLCTIYYSASGPQRIAALSDNRCDPRNTDDLLQNLVPFLAAGLTAK